MGNVCQSFFEEETEKITPLGAVSHWALGFSCNHRETLVSGVRVPAELGNCSRVPAELSSGDRKSFSATPKDFFRLYTQWVIYF